ncbi:MAG TPA: hypothetical protein VGK32_09680 [Vicinamibacterales bacterium]
MDRSELTYDPRGVFEARGGVPVDMFRELAPRLVEARDRTLADLAVLRAGGRAAEADEPNDAGFIDLPELLLEDYRQHGVDSEMGRIRAAGDRLAELVDRVVVVGIGGSYMGTRALFESLCRPYHNECSRDERNGRPRVHFDGYNVDSDPFEDLVQLLDHHSGEVTPGCPWGLIPVSKSGGTLEPAIVFRMLLERLDRACLGDRDVLRSLVIPVTGRTGRLHEIAAALGCPDIFPIPDDIGGRFSVLSAVGLLPAAVLGIDIVSLLDGATEMVRKFKVLPPGRNPVLDYVGVGHLMERERGARCRVLSVWGRQLEAVGYWYDQLLSESLGKDGHGATPITVVNTRDLHSRGQQHQQGARDKLITNVTVGHVRYPASPIGRSLTNLDQLDFLSEFRLTDVMDAAVLGTNRAYNGDGRPTADLRLSALDPYSVGQVLQFFMLATVVEGRLIGVNPYGQPGVEAYKREMNGILHQKAGSPRA